MGKKYLDTNVYDETMKRIAYCFNEFENVLVSFSGGKDSGILLNLCYDYAKANNMLDKLAMVHLDYEAQYEYTTQYVTRTFEKFNDIKTFWLCLPVSAQCACRMDDGSWIPWYKKDRHLWVREYPSHPSVITEDNAPFKVYVGKDDAETQDDFANYFVSQYGSTALMIGIRADESYERYKLVTASTNKYLSKYKDKLWIVDSKYDNLYRCYPLYDWAVDDIWIANFKFEYDYNELYDVFYQAGLSPSQMRVASPFNDCALASLKFYKVIEPNTWGKLVSRVNGVNFAGIYGGTTAMGWKSITKPEGHTWKSYCNFLLNTLDEKTRNHYLKKLEASKKSWLVGGALDEKTIAELKAENADCIYTGKTNNRGNRDKEVVVFPEYLDDTAVTDFRRIPTYKRMCICILKNDYYCKYMGFAQTKTEIALRKSAIEKYENLDI